jgi:hypothetical protein
VRNENNRIKLYKTANIANIFTTFAVSKLPEGLYIFTLRTSGCEGSGGVKKHWYCIFLQ